MMGISLVNMMQHLWYAGIVTGIQAFFEIWFIARYAKVAFKPVYWISYILMCCATGVVLTWLVTPPLVFVLARVAVIFIFTWLLFRLPPRRSAVPVIIITTLSTIMGGFESVLNRLVALNIHEPVTGILLILLISATSVALYGVALVLIARKIMPPSDTSVGRSAYMLLLPNALIIWAARVTLGLNEGYVAMTEDGAMDFPGLIPVWQAAMWMAACLAIFVALLWGFRRVAFAAPSENERQLLDEPVTAQRIYVQEAQARTEQLTSFQPAVDTHMVVLACLLEDNQKSDA